MKTIIEQSEIVAAIVANMSESGMTLPVTDIEFKKPRKGVGVTVEVTFSADATAEQGEVNVIEPVVKTRKPRASKEVETVADVEETPACGIPEPEPEVNPNKTEKTTDGLFGTS